MQLLICLSLSLSNSNPIQILSSQHRSSVSKGIMYRMLVCLTNQACGLLVYKQKCTEYQMCCSNGKDLIIFDTPPVKSQQIISPKKERAMTLRVSNLMGCSHVCLAWRVEVSLWHNNYSKPPHVVHACVERERS